MDGSCCSALELGDEAAEQQCVGLVKSAIVPKVEEAIDAQCGGSFIDLISASISKLSMKQKVEPVKLDQEDFKQCLVGKINTAKDSCDGQDCTPECYAALKKAVGSMDGSCCSALELH